MPLPGSILPGDGHILDNDEPFAEAFVRDVDRFPEENPAG